MGHPWGDEAMTRSESSCLGGGLLHARSQHAYIVILSAKFGAFSSVCGKQSDRSGLREGGFVGDSWQGRLVGEARSVWMGACSYDLSSGDNFHCLSASAQAPWPSRRVLQVRTRCSNP